MLVLTTMFVSVSNELPKTSYMKMVDYWLVFNLFIPFAEVLLHVYMVRRNTVGGVLKDFGKDAMSIDNNGSEKANIKRINVESITTKEVVTFHKLEGKLFTVQFIHLVQRHVFLKFFIACLQDGQKSVNKKIGKLKLFNIVAKTVNPLIIVSFAVIYWIIGFIVYFNPT